MTHCRNYHSEPKSADCPWCVILVLTLALEEVDPCNPALTPAMVILDKSRRGFSLRLVEEPR